MEKSIPHKSNDLEPIIQFYKYLEKKAQSPNLDWKELRKSEEYTDPVSEYTNVIYKKFNKTSLKTEKILFKDLLNILSGVLISSKFLTKNFVDLYSNHPQWSKYHKNPLVGNLGLFSYKIPHPVHKPLKMQLARYLALIAYGRIHIHKLYKKNNLDIIYLNTDGFISTKPLPPHVLGEKLGELRFKHEIGFINNRPYIGTDK